MRRSVAAVLGLLMVAGFTAAFGTPAAAHQGKISKIFTVEAMSGYARFHPDPHGSQPGDAIGACDSHRDGWGVEAYLFVFDGSYYLDRKVANGGAGTCSKWKTGNIPEGTEVMFYACLKKGSTYSTCSEWSFAVA